MILISGKDHGKETTETSRRRILGDMDTETLRTLLTLVKLECGGDNVGESNEAALEDAILSELEHRDGEGASNFVIDWNERFQALLAEPDSLEKFAQLRNLANDFCFTAELYARIIISELYLPTSQKTIKPSSVGGVAGGQKFVVQGILFKFAVDVELRKASHNAGPNAITSSNPSSGIEPGSSPFTSKQMIRVKTRSNSSASQTPPLNDSSNSIAMPNSPKIVVVTATQSTSSPTTFSPPSSSVSSPSPSPLPSSNNNTGSLWMYGGAVPSTEFAMKAAKHELRSTIAYFSTSTCRVPLVALVDFRGYRVLCSSVLPIDNTTICYGSSDAGRTVHADADAAVLFESAGEKLNLKKHKFKGYDLCAPVDIEGHHGHDGNMYCIDLARLFPPEAPPLSLQSHSRAIYFRLLRPELVRSFPSALSSDAFTNFGASDELSHEHNAEVENATKHLQTVVLPQFATWLCTISSTVNSFSSLVYHMHRRGINLRYLGLLRTYIEIPDEEKQIANNTDMKGGAGTEIHAAIERVYIPVIAHSHLSLHRSLEGSDSYYSNPFDSNGDESASRSHHDDDITSGNFSAPSPLRSSRAVAAVTRPYVTETIIRQLILEEMIARVLKCMLRAQWRRRMQEVRICTETPFAEAAIDLLNIAACKYSTRSGPALSKLFWTSQLKAELVNKFQVGLTPRELHEDFDLMSSIELRSLLERFTSLVGVQMALSNEILAQTKRPFLYTDLLGIASTIHHMNIIDFAEGRLLALTARKRDKQLKLQLLAMAEKKLTAAHASGTHISLAVVFELANVHYQQAMLLPLNQSSSNVVEAIRCYISALQLATPTTAASIVGKCHIRLLRLYFEKIGSNLLLQEQALQSQGIPQLSLAAHLNHAAVMRPKALRKLIASVSQLNDIEPSCNLRSSFLPDCSKTTCWGELLTCLVHANTQAREIASEIFNSMTWLNFQFTPQLLDPLNSGWMIGTARGDWTWTALESVDFTACLTVTPKLVGELIQSKCPHLKHLYLNHCQSIDDSLAQELKGANKLETLEISFCNISDRFFEAIVSQESLEHSSEDDDASTSIFKSLKCLNVHGCVLITDEALKIVCHNQTGATQLTAILLDSCPKIRDIRPLKKLKHLTELRISDSRVPENRFREILKVLMPKLLVLDIGCTSVTNETFEFLKQHLNDSKHHASDSKPSHGDQKHVSGEQKSESKSDSKHSHSHSTDSLKHRSNSSASSSTPSLIIPSEINPSKGVYPLQFLGLRKTKLTREIFAFFSYAFPKLQTLNITANELGHGFGKHVRFNHLKNFECGLDKYTSGCDSALVALKTCDAKLNQLNIRSGVSIVTDAVLLLSVRTFPDLVSLNISVCPFLSNAAMEAVSKLSQLRFLSLSGNRQLVDSALMRITKALGGTLTGLEIAHCKQLTTVALEQTCRSCTELRYLDVSFVESFKKIHMVGTYCLKLEHFKAVGLTTCAPESFQRFFRRGVSPRRLNFKSCPITNDTVLECAYSSRFLMEICLSDCSAVDDIGITRLLQLCRYLHRLELTSVSVSDASFESGKKSLACIRHLVVSGCRKLTDKTLNLLSSFAPLLEFLNCSGCPLLSEQAFLGLVSSAKWIRSASVSFCPKIPEDSALQALQAKGATLVR